MNQTPADSQPGVPPISPTPNSPFAGEDPADRETIIGPTSLVEAILRHPRRVIYQLRHGSPGRLILPLLAVAVAFAAVYGLIVGSFSGGVQWWMSPVKIALGMIVTATICLPSLYIFACLCGSPARLHEVMGALGGMLALITLLLIGFGPVAWLFSQSTESVAMMGFLHLLFWLVAARFGVRFLLTAFRQFGLRSESGLNVWVVIFLLVSLQMTAALRPLIGRSDALLPAEKKFFVAHWLDCVNTKYVKGDR
jgi:hypothetical protein